VRLCYYLSPKISAYSGARTRQSGFGACTEFQVFPLGPIPPELAKEGRIKIANWTRKTTKRDRDPGVKEGEKSIYLDLQLVVQLIIDIDDCDKQLENRLPSLLRPRTDSNFSLIVTAASTLQHDAGYSQKNSH